MPEKVSCPVRCTLVPVNGAYPSAGEDSRWAEPDSHHAAEILRRLKQRNYSGNVIAELYACDPHYVLEDAATSVRWLKEQLDA